MAFEYPKPYSSQSVDRIMRDMGVSRAEAERIAATEMDGANHNSDGSINARQTHCGTLRYSENIRPSRGAQEGAQTSREAAAQELGINISGLTPEQADRAIEAATNRRYGIR